MKKLTKIFAVLLTACLLFGIVAVSSYAKTTVDAFNITKHEYNRNNDFSTSSTSADKLSYAIRANYSTATFNPISTTGTDAVNERVYDEISGNYYLRYRMDSALNEYSPSALTKYYLLSNFSATATNSRYLEGNMVDFDFVTVDFDFGTDMWAYQYYDESGKKVWETAKEVPDYAIEGTAAPALFQESGNYSRLLIKAYSEADTYQSSADALAYSIHIVKHEDGMFYASPMDSANAARPSATYDDDIKLSNVPGIFDHITCAFQMELVNPSQGKGDSPEYHVYAHTYINGEFFSTVLVEDSKGVTELEACCLRRLYSNWSTSNFSGDDNYSICLDNVAINYYENYDFTNTQGLGAFLNGTPGAPAKYSDCNDVLYSDEYYYPGLPIFAAITRVDGSKKDCYSLASVRKSIKSGDIVELYTSLENYVPSSQDVRYVTFKVKENGAFSVADGVEEYYLLQNIGETYTLKQASDDAMKIKWYDSEGEGRKLLKEQVLMPLFVPDASVDVLQIFGKVSADKIQIFKGWKLDVDNDGKADMDYEFSEMTVAEIDELYDSGITEINMVPIFEETEIAYLVEMASSKGGEKPDLYAPDYNYLKFTDITTISSTIAGLAKNSVVKITLYKDLDLSELTINVPNTVTVSFDLHGYSVKAKSTAFNLSGDAVFNLYSTVNGGSLIQTDSSASAGLISASDFNSCTINIGKMLNSDKSVLANGFDMTVSAKSVLSFSASADTKQKNAVVNINGGYYYGVYAGGNMFSLTNANVDLNISGAVIASQAGSPIFASASDNKLTEDVSVSDNSVIVSGVFDGDFESAALISGWSDSCKLNVSQSKIIGSDLNKANVTLGKNNMLSLDVADDFVKTESGVGFARSNNGVVKEMLWFAEIGLSVEYLALTFELDVPAVERTGAFKNIVPVTWLDLENKTYKTNYWCIGSNADYIEVNFGIKELNNGWYNEVYDGWVNTTDGEDAASQCIVADKNNTFSPVTKGLVSALDVKESFEVADNFYYNVYLPKLPVVEGVTITFDGFFDADGNLIASYDNVTLEGVEGFYQLRTSLDPQDFVSGDITIKFTVNSKTFEKKVNVSFFDYAYKVDASFGSCSDESKLVYAMLEYKLYVYEDVLGEDADPNVRVAVNAYKNSHGASCTCADVEYTAPTEELDYEALDGIFGGVSYSLLVTDDFTSKYTMSFYADSSVTAVSAKIVSDLGETTLVFEKIEQDGYVEYRCNDVPLWLVSRIMTITATTADSELVGTISLAEYISYAEDTDVAKALYVISETAYDKKKAE